MEKFLLFSTGAGNDDLQNLQGNEVALYKATDLVTARPSSIRTIDLLFRSESGSHDTVTLGIKGGQHYKVLRSISQAIATQNNNNTIISIADMDGYRFIDPNIWSVSIKRNYIDVMKVTSSARHFEIPVNSMARIKSVNITNTSDSTTIDDVHVYIADQTGSDITDTGTNVNNGSGYAVTIDSTAVTVDGTSATNLTFVNEKVYNSAGRLYGLCSAVGSTTQITFATGLENGMADDDSLYTGTRYTIIKVDIPPSTTFVLESEDVNFDINKYKLYIQSNVADVIEAIVRY